MTSQMTLPEAITGGLAGALLPIIVIGIPFLIIFLVVVIIRSVFRTNVKVDLMEKQNQLLGAWNKLRNRRQRIDDSKIG